MSLATRQAQFMLTMVHASLRLIADEPRLLEEIAPTVLWADTFSREAVDRYPATGDIRKNALWMKEHLKRWDQIVSDKMIRWHPGVVETFALNFVEDLLAKINNSARSDLVTLRDALVRISYFFTDGEDYLIFDEATEVTDELYSVIGFSR